jgi:hypothetical protein
LNERGRKGEERLHEPLEAVIIQVRVDNFEGGRRREIERKHRYVDNTTGQARGWG